MMTLSPGNLGINDMKKQLLVLLLAVCALLCGCGGRERYSLEEAGFVLADSETGVRYTALSPAFEPAKGGASLGAYRSATEEEVSVRAIPGLEEALWLADDDKTVFCADTATPDPAAWVLTAVLFCEEDVVSVERCRLTAGANDAALALLRTLYFEGEDGVLPLTAAALVRRVKLVSAELPNIYYCFDYYRYEDGSAYFYERFSGRTVEIPAESDALFGVI